MKPLSRRRFLTISAGAATATALAGPVGATPLFRWQGMALGASASITLAHPDAENIVARARQEIARLEGVFSLFQSESALGRLNRQGRLANPPFELLECLGLCGAVHAATEGAFDPTVQPLWALHARAAASGTFPHADEIEATLAQVGWQHLVYDATEIRFRRPGMALTLNGIAQGYIADRVALLLRREGLTDVLVDTGEMRAIGAMPSDPKGWPVSLQVGDTTLPNALRLREMALASSAPLGTVLDAAGRVGHVMDPLTGRSAPARWQLVSITAPRAAVADGLSTAGCLMSKERLATAIAAFPSTAIARLV